jgi:hypothetical protein
MNSSRAVSLLHIIALTLDSIALIALSQYPLLSNLIFAGCILIGASLIYIFDFSEKFISAPKS